MLQWCKESSGPELRAEDGCFIQVGPVNLIMLDVGPPKGLYMCNSNGHYHMINLQSEFTKENHVV